MIPERGGGGDGSHNTVRQDKGEGRRKVNGRRGDGHTPAHKYPSASGSSQCLSLSAEHTHS